MKKLIALFALALTAGVSAHAADYKTTYETMNAPEQEVTLNGGAFLIFGFEYLEKSTPEMICAKTKAPEGIPSAYACYTPTIAGDAAMNRYERLPLELALEFSQNGERVLGVAVDQKMDGLGFCRKVTPVVPNAPGAFTCYEPAR